MTFFAELKRRNVFRATLAYAVFAWLLLQVVEFVLEVVGSPDWVLRVLVVLALAGLPAVAGPTMTGVLPPRSEASSAFATSVAISSWMAKMSSSGRV